MSTLKINKHADVPAALDLVKEEVGKEAKRIFIAGGDALKTGKIKPAKEAIAYAEELDDFVVKVEQLGAEWAKLRAKIDAAAPDVKEIVLPVAPSKSHKTGFKRKVNGISPKTNFIVTFPDGTVISDKKAYWVMAKTIKKLGADRVAALDIQVGGEPLVTQDRAFYKKHPSAVAEIAGGWFVKTHSGTAAKMGYVKRAAKLLKVNLVVKSC